jgi:hypothetical protein
VKSAAKNLIKMYYVQKRLGLLDSFGLLLPEAGQIVWSRAGMNPDHLLTDQQLGGAPERERFIVVFDRNTGCKRDIELELGESRIHKDKHISPTCEVLESTPFDF